MRYFHETLIGVLFLLSPSRAVAQECPREPDHVLLARTCVSERGWRIETDDCQAVWEVVLARMESRDETAREAICALSPRLHGGTVSRAWLQDLDEDAHRPRGLHARWERARGDLPSRHDAWLATLAQTRGMIDAGVYAPRICERPPFAWGSDEDLVYRARLGFGWTEIECGDTVNHFGRVLVRRRRDVDPE